MTTSLILIVLSVLGMINAAYLSYAHLLDSGGCGNGFGCDEVVASPYSNLGGVPFSVFGLGLYVAILIASWRSLHGNLRAESMRWISLFALVGNLPTLFLLYLQAFVIGAWCPFCALSAATILSILVLSLTDRNRNTMLRPFVGSLISR
ncbi:MAG: vitamin K epoxide reductase family protein, partial [Candidatus Latescibacterota bacterium]|nr:vitamin K epoxide reductase family protein [Candidatus Latescibacterota bacterium]